MSQKHQTSVIIYFFTLYSFHIMVSSKCFTMF